MRARINDRTTGRALSILGLSLASCSGNLPGTGLVDAPLERARRVETRTVETRTVENAGARASTPAVVAEPYASASASTLPAPAAPVPPPQVSSAPAASFADPRDRQFEILTEAVTALRQEVARSYEH
ncbi:MAG: hypothetical protein ACREQQ_12580, partial [Candidatus Binatia bacterium]